MIINMSINKSLYSSASDSWSTPLELFAALDSKYHFTLDPCASAQNAKCENYFTIEDDGLKQDWFGRVFCNPPYGRQIGKWVDKCWKESFRCQCVVALLPARTDTIWFHRYIYNQAKKIYFLKGRLHFNGSKNPAPFPSMIVVF